MTRRCSTATTTTGSPSLAITICLIGLVMVICLATSAEADPNTQLDRLKDMFLNSYQNSVKRVRSKTDKMMRSAQLNARGGVHETALIQFEMMRKKLADLSTTDVSNAMAEEAASELDADLERQEQDLFEKQVQQQKQLAKVFSHKGGAKQRLNPIIVSRLDTRRGQPRRLLLPVATSASASSYMVPTQAPQVQWYGKAAAIPTVATTATYVAATAIRPSRFRVPDYAPTPSPVKDQLSVTVGEKGRRFYSSEGTAPVRPGSADIIGHSRSTISPLDRQIASIMRGNTDSLGF